jgi:hypothetical protein
MFETTSKAAEKMAISLSRRSFLGSLSRQAGATALALAGVLATSGTACASGLCCYRWYINQWGFKQFCKYATGAGGRCQYGRPFDCNAVPYAWCSLG